MSIWRRNDAERRLDKILWDKRDEKKKFLTKSVSASPIAVKLDAYLEKYIRLYENLECYDGFSGTIQQEIGDPVVLVNLNSSIMLLCETSETEIAPTFETFPQFMFNKCLYLTGEHVKAAEFFEKHFVPVLQQSIEGGNPESLNVRIYSSVFAEVVYLRCKSLLEKHRSEKMNKISGTVSQMILYLGVAESILYGLASDRNLPAGSNKQGKNFRNTQSNILSKLISVCKLHLEVLLFYQIGSSEVKGFYTVCAFFVRAFYVNVPHTADKNMLEFLDILASVSVAHLNWNLLNLTIYPGLSSEKSPTQNKLLGFININLPPSWQPPRDLFIRNSIENLLLIYLIKYSKIMEDIKLISTNSTSPISSSNVNSQTSPTSPNSNGSPATKSELTVVEGINHIRNIQDAIVILLLYQGNFTFLAPILFHGIYAAYQNSRSWLKVAQAFFCGGQYEMAESAFSQSLFLVDRTTTPHDSTNTSIPVMQIDPPLNDETLHNTSVKIFYIKMLMNRTKNYEKALKLCETFLKSSKNANCSGDEAENIKKLPDESTAVISVFFLARGVCYMELALASLVQGKKNEYLKKALESFKEAFQLDPQDHETAFFFALTLAVMGKIDLALKYIIQSINMCGTPRAIHLMVLLLSAKKAYSDAYNILTGSLQEFPGNFILAICQIKLERIVCGAKKSLTSCRRAISTWRKYWPQSSQKEYSSSADSESVRKSHHPSFQNTSSEAAIQEKLERDCPDDFTISSIGEKQNINVDSYSASFSLMSNEIFHNFATRDEMMPDFDQSTNGGTTLKSTNHSGAFSSFSEGLGSLNRISIPKDRSNTSGAMSSVTKKRSTRMKTNWLGSGVLTSPSYSGVHTMPTSSSTATTPEDTRGMFDEGSEGIYLELMRNLWLESAECYLELEAFDQVQSCLREACRLGSLNPDLLCIQGRLAQKLGSTHAQIIVYYETALSVDPQNAIACRNLSKQHLENYLHQKTEKLGKTKESDSRKSLMEENAVKERLIRESLDSAEQVARMSLQIDSSDCESWMMLGKILNEAGKFSEASDCFCKGLQLEATSPFMPFSTVPRQFRASDCE